MKYEIGNPSDKCFISTDDDKVAAAAVLFLGNGQYFCIPLEGDTSRKFPTFFALGGDLNKTWTEFYGVTFDAFMEERANREKLVQCFASFEYDGDRTSMNNIGKRASGYANALRKQLEDLK